MESLKQITESATPSLRRKCKLRRSLCLALLAAVVVAAILVIVIPPAIIVPRKHREKGKPSTVLFPVYIYPETNSTWAPFYQAIAMHPELDFIAIVNPQSGPGPSPSPGLQYSVAVRRLSTYSNVQKVGYIPTDYGNRNISAVLADVATYSDWALQSPALAMDGIFFDEIPYVYSTEKAEYLDRINEAVKTANGIQREHLVIHNPGTIPDPRFGDSTTDITVVFEQSYDEYRAKEELLADKLRTSERDTHAYIIHSVPTMTNSSLRHFVNGLSQRAAYLFLTERSTDYYEGFDPRLEQFCNVVPTDQHE